jgi:hypothetical protein
MNSNPLIILSDSSLTFSYWMAGILLIYPIMTLIGRSFSNKKCRIAFNLTVLIAYLVAFMLANPIVTDALISAIVLPLMFVVCSVGAIMLSLYFKKR